MSDPWCGLYFCIYAEKHAETIHYTMGITNPQNLNKIQFGKTIAIKEVSIYLGNDWIIKISVIACRKFSIMSDRSMIPISLSKCDNG